MARAVPKDAAFPAQKGGARRRSIKVRWRNETFQERPKTFAVRKARIIQHEIHYCEGVII